MTGAAAELVERLYRRLVQAAAERDGGSAGPFTVADLYQHLIPYRGVRGDLGVLELAQYEHALLRLLAGEGGYLRLRDEDARREVAAELRASNPILGIYRDYAAVGVELVEAPAAEGRDTADRMSPTPATAAEDDRREREVRDVAELISDELEEDEDAWDLVAQPLPELAYPPPRPAPADATRVEQPIAPPPPPATRPAAPAPASSPMAPASASPSAAPAPASPSTAPAPASPPLAQASASPPLAPASASPPLAPASPSPSMTPAPASPSMAPAPASHPAAASPRPGPPQAAPASPPPASALGAGAAPAAGAMAAGAERRCVACGQALPDVEGVRFCPVCGTDQIDVPCARCATPILGSWNFCIRCGARRPTATPSA